MIKKGELKLRINQAVENLIDIYFGNNTIIESMTNATLKVLLRNNISKLDDLIDLFADKDGYIDADSVIMTYAEQLGTNGVEFNIKDYIKSDFVKDIMPNKSLIIHKDDLLKIMKVNTLVKDA